MAHVGQVAEHVEGPEHVQGLPRCDESLDVETTHG